MKYYLLIFIFLSCQPKTEQKTSTAQIKFEKKRLVNLEKNRISSEKFLRNIEQVKGLEIIYISPGKNYYSWLGHLILRFTRDSLDPAGDYSVSFVADFKDFKLDMIKAYFGGYEVLPEIKTFQEMIQDYVITEDRYMKRFKLKIEKTKLRSILSTLKQWILDPSIPGAYSFRRNSCTALPLRLLVNGMDIDPDYIGFPIDVVNYFKAKKLVEYSYPVLNKKNYQQELKNTVLAYE
jgi:hypothetical protein